MKNCLFISIFLLFTSFAISAQNKVTAKVKVDQPDALELDASGEPATVGDITKFTIKGGTPPYSDYDWKDSNEPGKTNTVTVTDANNCSVTIYVNVGGTDIEEINVQSANIYPNPVVDIVNIPLPAGETNVVLQLIESNGRVILKHSIPVLDSEFPLSLETCSPGRYFIQIIGSDTKTYSVIKK